MLKKWKLDLAAFQDVIPSVSEMKEFYLAKFNNKRRSPRMLENTWRKHLERLILFLAYCATTLKVKPALSLVVDLALVEGFMNYLKKDRQVQNTTAALIYPVDVVFHWQDGAYKLRTPKKRLCSLVKN